VINVIHNSCGNICVHHLNAVGVVMALCGRSSATEGRFPFTGYMADGHWHSRCPQGTFHGVGSRLYANHHYRVSCRRSDCLALLKAFSTSFHVALAARTTALTSVPSKAESSMEYAEVGSRSLDQTWPNAAMLLAVRASWPSEAPPERRGCRQSQLPVLHHRDRRVDQVADANWCLGPPRVFLSCGETVVSAVGGV
jgi:hypothetical protein